MAAYLFVFCQDAVIIYYHLNFLKDIIPSECQDRHNFRFKAILWIELVQGYENCLGCRYVSYFNIYQWKLGRGLALVPWKVFENTNLVQIYILLARKLRHRGMLLSTGHQQISSRTCARTCCPESKARPLSVCSAASWLTGPAIFHPVFLYKAYSSTGPTLRQYKCVPLTYLTPCCFSYNDEQDKKGNENKSFHLWTDHKVPGIVLGTLQMPALTLYNSESVSIFQARKLKHRGRLPKIVW